MTTLKEEDSFRITEKAKEAGKITSNGLCNLVLEEFKAFKKAKEDITRSTIEENHINGKPAFSNMTVKDVEAFKDPFQICKCYMPSTKAIRKIDHIEKVDFYTLITVIHNFVPLKEKLDVYFKARKEAKCIHGFEKQKTLSTEKKLFDYVDLLIRLLRVVEAVGQEDKSISRAIKLLEEMRISLETTAYKRSAFPTTDKRELIDESTLSESSTEANPCVDEPIPSDDSILLGESSTGANPGVEADLLDGVKLRQTVYQNLNLDKRELIDESTLNESSTDAIFCVDEPQLSDDKSFSESTFGANPYLDHTTVQQIEDFEPADRKKVDDICIATLPDLKEDWNVCLDAADENHAKELITKKILPDKHQLNKACTIFGKTSDITKEILSSIEDEITTLSDNIIYTEASYRETDQNKIVFVVYTAGIMDDIDEAVEKYSVLVRCFHHFSQEVNDVAQKEMQEGMQFGENEMAELENILKTKSPKLMKDHTNLTLTTASNFKSLHYENCREENQLKKKVCIVFYVTTKGFIPVGEDVLPRKLDKFDTDVREGRFIFVGGDSPGAKHQHLKIGCQIGCKNGSGTIGGFVLHPDHNVCALTCAHVLLNKEEILSLKKKKPNYEVGKQCFQPYCKEKEESKCGHLVLAQINENAGVDAALVKIDEDRMPTKGDFPNLNHKDIEGHCSHCKDDLLKTKLDFKSGIVLDTDDIHCQDYVVKYGQKTKLTVGRIKVIGGSAKGDCLDLNKMKPTRKGKEQKRFTITLHNLIQVHDIGATFARPGDSGSLVFSRDQKNKLSAFGILEGCMPNANITLVQPIYSVLEEMGMQRPFSMINFDPRDRRIDGLEKNVQRILDKLDSK